MKTYLVTIIRKEECFISIRAKSAEDAKNAVEDGMHDLPLRWDYPETEVIANEDDNAISSPDYEVNEDGELVDPQ